MKREELNRRDFTRLTAAAFGGLMAGTVIGCGGGNKDAGTASTEGGDAGTDAAAAGGDAAEGGDKPAGEGDKPEIGTLAEVPNNWTGDVHVCRGLNACMNKGPEGTENACAGQGQCATAEHHSCHGENACKYQGGCGESVGQNACKGTGECAVPLSEGAWKKARASFEMAMQAAEKKFGDAPAKADSEG